MSKKNYGYLVIYKQRADSFADQRNLFFNVDGVSYTSTFTYRTAGLIYKSKRDAKLCIKQMTANNVNRYLFMRILRVDLTETIKVNTSSNSTQRQDDEDPDFIEFG